jgi:hypothetical protein
MREEHEIDVLRWDHGELAEEVYRENKRQTLLHLLGEQELDAPM